MLGSAGGVLLCVSLFPLGTADATPGSSSHPWDREPPAERGGGDGETGQSGALYKWHQPWLAHHPPSCYQRKTPLLV